jgi:hypothetical protein
MGCLDYLTALEWHLEWHLDPMDLTLSESANVAIAFVA